VTENADELLARARAWLEADPDPETRAELAALLDRQALTEIASAFGSVKTPWAAKHRNSPAYSPLHVWVWFGTSSPASAATQARRGFTVEPGRSASVAGSAPR